MSTNNKYSSIVPFNMGRQELKHIIIDINTAKNWNQDHCMVDVRTGLDLQGKPTYTECMIMLENLKSYVVELNSRYKH